MTVFLHDPAELQDAAHTIHMLARGLDPRSNEKLRPQDICNDPKIIRSLFIAADVLRKIGYKRERPSAETPERLGQAWTPTEDAQLDAAFKERQCLRSIAARHKRSRGAILARLVARGHIRERAEGLRILR